MKPEKDVIIIGGGAAGLSAAQYAARANLSVLLMEEMATGGQAMIIDSVENYPALNIPLSGFDFSQQMEGQALKFGAVINNDSVTSVRKEGNLFTVETTSGPHTTFAVIIATGAKHRKLGVPGEAEFSGKGVSYCATCDGPFFKDKRMFVVGGGDAACDEAMFLAKLSKDLIVVHRRDRFRAQKALAERVLSTASIRVLFNTEMKEIRGDKSVGSVVLYDNAEKKVFTEKADAVFVFVGSIPQTNLVSQLPVEFDEAGYIVTNQKMETALPGLYAVGDVRATPFRQLVVAASDGAIAAHCASQYIDELEGKKYG